MDEGLAIRAATQEEAARLQALELAEWPPDGEAPLSIDQVRALYDALLSDDDKPVEMQIAVGIASGDLMAEAADHEWIGVTDEYGSETSLAPRGFHDSGMKS